jgi:hypothetical protein
MGGPIAHPRRSALNQQANDSPPSLVRYEPGYPKAVYALNGGRPVEGICNSSADLRWFEERHSLVHAIPMS